MELTPYLSFNGQCEEAFKFYAELFGGKIEAMFPYSGTPAEQYVSPEWAAKIMHAKLSLGDASLMASDNPPDRVSETKGFHVSVHPKNRSEGERIFKGLSENGTITMPFEPTFWASGGFGMCVDRFGIPWMVNVANA